MKKKNILIVAVTAIIFTLVGVGAASMFKASDVEYTPKDTSWEVDNLGDALDSLYEKANSCGSYEKYIEEYCNSMLNVPVNFDYTGEEEVFEVKCAGTYKLETWGAQGGIGYYDRSGYGGYSVGVIESEKDKFLYINVGGAGSSKELKKSLVVTGGYNGGGGAYTTNADQTIASGGGATHIATKPGELYQLKKYKDSAGTNLSKEILIVSGGGGGSAGWHINGWKCNFTGGSHSGGGYMTNSDSATNSGGGNVTVNGATQTSGFEFGRADQTGVGAGAGGGGGWYGGNTNEMIGTGGTGYISSPKLMSNENIQKHMTCYNCPTSNDEKTKTVSTTCTDKEPKENCSKQGNGYARITLISLN